MCSASRARSTSRKRPSSASRPGGAGGDAPRDVGRGPVPAPGAGPPGGAGGPLPRAPPTPRGPPRRPRGAPPRPPRRPPRLRTRLVALMIVLGVGFAAMVVGLVDVQGTSAGRYAVVGQSQRLHTVELAAQRGSILDRNGAELAVSVPRQTVWADP